MSGTVLSLPYDVKSVVLARRFVEQFVAEQAPGGAAAALLVIASELVTNAIVHGAEPVELSLHHRDGEVTIEVADGDPGIDNVRLRALDQIARTGRGLRVVASSGRPLGNTAEAIRENSVGHKAHNAPIPRLNGSGKVRALVPNSRDGLRPRVPWSEHCRHSVRRTGRLATNHRPQCEWASRAPRRVECADSELLVRGRRSAGRVHEHRPKNPPGWSRARGQDAWRGGRNATTRAAGRTTERARLVALVVRLGRQVVSAGIVTAVRPSGSGCTTGCLWVRGRSVGTRHHHDVGRLHPGHPLHRVGDGAPRFSYSLILRSAVRRRPR